MQWRLADAKNRFSELVNLALSEGPQRVVRRNDVVIVVSARDFEKLSAGQPSFTQFLLGTGSDTEELDFGALDLRRDSSSMRESGV